MKKNVSVILVLVLAAGCGALQEGPFDPPMDPSRRIAEQDCSKPVVTDGGNLRCREITAAERRAMAAEEERQARARREAAEREARAKREAEELAERQRLERERAEQLAREEAARKAKAAEEERLAAERRAAELEAARKAQEERERQERLAAEEAARKRAEQEAREAAERECRRLAMERQEGRALLTNFVTNYGQVEENKGIAGQITEFLGKDSAKPCP